MDTEVQNTNLVAVSFQNGIGNFIMLTPAIQALAELYNAKVDIVLDNSWRDSRRESIEEFGRLWPLVNEVINFQDGFDKDKYKMLFYSNHGETSEASTYFKTHSPMAPVHINWRVSKAHEVDFYMEDVRNLGYTGKTPKQYTINGHDGASGRYNTILYLGNSRYFRVGICNGLFAGSKWRWERKGYPHYEKLVDMLYDYYGGEIRIYLFGKGEREQEWASRVKEGREYVFNTVDKLSLNGCVQIMKRLHLFITTDTGLMHVCDALEKQMLVLFGPTLVSKNGPYNSMGKICKSAIKCSPCQQTPFFHACEKFECMERLTPDMVFTDIREYVRELVYNYRLQIGKNGEEIKPCLL